MRRASSPVLALLALLATAGCSSFELFYGFADSYIEREAADYLELDAADEAHLERQVAALVAWHRMAMLPRYATFLNGAAATIEDGRWSPSVAQAGVDDLRRLMDDTVAGVARHAAPVLARQTTPQRRAYLARQLLDDGKSETAPVSQAVLIAQRNNHINERSERMIDNFERFTGPLTDAQAAIIRRHVSAGIDSRSRWRGYRAKRRQALLDTLASNPSEPRLETFIFNALMRAETIVGPQYRDEANRWWAGIATLTFDVVAALDEHQRRMLIGNLRGYAEDMLAVSG